MVQSKQSTLCPSMSANWLYTITPSSTYQTSYSSHLFFGKCLFTAVTFQFVCSYTAAISPFMIFWMHEGYSLILSGRFYSDIHQTLSKQCRIFPQPKILIFCIEIRHLPNGRVRYDLEIPSKSPPSGESGESSGGGGCGDII